MGVNEPLIRADVLENRVFSVVFHELGHWLQDMILLTTHTLQEAENLCVLVRALR